MSLDHYLGLYPAYFAALIGYLFLAPYFRPPAVADPPTFQKPWLECLLAFGAIFITLLIGQLFSKNLLLPHGFLLTDSLNQLLIFAPFPVLLLWRRHSLQTAWVQRAGHWRSLLLGLILAILAVLVFLLTKGRITESGSALRSIYSPSSLPMLVQVFLEDFAIAVCFFRFAAWVGNSWAILSIGLLFALGHIPAMLAVGVAVEGMTSLLFDAGLAVFVLYVLSRSRDILWFWMLHFAMDMTQFL